MQRTAAVIGFGLALALACVDASAAGEAVDAPRPRAREAGIVIGTLATGPLNAIVDVDGVRVGQVTLEKGRELHTGVTAVLPHGGNPYLERVPAAIVVGNGFGKLVGSTQVQELGELESPILLTGTLNVWRVADAAVSWMLEKPGMENVRSLNMVVGETNDGWLSDIRSRPVGAAEVRQALDTASGAMPAEGVVGAGAGTVAFGWKGGIGTSSRRASVEGASAEYTVGVLVQSNYGGQLVIGGMPFRDKPKLADAGLLRRHGETGDGSVMVVVATDAPLDARQLQRLARRALIGIARTGSVMSNGSGDYVIAFSTARQNRMKVGAASNTASVVGNDAITPLFQAAAEATEEAALDSLFKAHTVQGMHGTAEELPLDEVLRRYRAASVR